MGPKQSSQSGFSLIEAMIVVGIVGVVASGITSLFSLLIQNTENVDFRITSMSETLAIQSVLMNETACLNTFGGKKPAVPVTVPTIKTASNSTFATVSQKRVAAALQSLTLVNGSVDPADFAQLNVTFWPPQQSYSVKDGSILLSVVKDTNGAITRCSAYGIPQTKSVLANVTCAAGKVMQGFDGDGNPVCVSSAASAPPPAAAPAPPIVVAPTSPCGGTKPYGSTVTTWPDDGTGSKMGLTCGKATGVNVQCFSCNAAWVYTSPPKSGNTILCNCQ